MLFSTKEMAVYKLFRFSCETLPHGHPNVMLINNLDKNRNFSMERIFANNFHNAGGVRNNMLFINF